MAALSAFYPYVLPSVPGASELTVDHYLRQTAISFLQDTSLWVQTSTVSIISNQSAYTITNPTDGQVFKVMEASVNNTPLFMGLASILYPAITAQYPTTYISGDDPSTFSVWPTPTSSVTMTYRYILIPTQTAATLPDFLFNDWAEAIGAGTVARLTEQPGTSYFNPTVAQMRWRDYNSFKSRAKALHTQQYITRSPKVQPVWFGA